MKPKLLRPKINRVATLKNFLGQLSRENWLNVHRLIGLSLGLLLAVVCLTGSLAIHHQTWDRLFDSKPTITKPGKTALAPDRILAAAQASTPNSHGQWLVEFPQTPEQAFSAWQVSPKGAYTDQANSRVVFINPYTAEVIDTQDLKSVSRSPIVAWHTQLFGPATLALLALALLLMVLAGIILWWPGRENWKQSLRPTELGTRPHSLILWLHGSFGLLSALPLILISVTGLALASLPVFSGFAEPKETMGHDEKTSIVRSSGIPNNHPVTLAQAVVIAKGLFPKSEVFRVGVPERDNGAYWVNLIKAEEAHTHHPRTLVWVDRWSGQILAVENSGKAASKPLIQKLKTLHTAESLGSLTRIVWFCAGFGPLLLSLSGIYSCLVRMGVLRASPINFKRLSFSPNKD